MAKNQTGRILASVALMAAALLWASSASAQNTQTQSDQKAYPKAEATRAQGANHWKDGDQVYDKVCKYCHEVGIGPDLKGAHYASQLTVAMVRVGPAAMPSFHKTDIDDDVLKKLGDMLQTADGPEKPYSSNPIYIAPRSSVTAPVKAKTVPE